MSTQYDIYVDGKVHSTVDDKSYIPDEIAIIRKNFPGASIVIQHYETTVKQLNSWVIYPAATVEWLTIPLQSTTPPYHLRESPKTTNKRESTHIILNRKCGRVTVQLNLPRPFDFPSLRRLLVWLEEKSKPENFGIHTDFVDINVDCDV